MSGLTEEDRQLMQDAAERYVTSNYPFEDREKRRQTHGRFGSNWAAFAELGWLALPVAEQAGGLGGGATDVQSLMRAFGRGLIDEPFAEVAVLAAKALEYCAPADQRERLLSPLVVGEAMPILAHGEDRADLDYSSVGTAAVAESEGFALSGVKRSVNQAGAADAFLVTALLEGRPALFHVPRELDGLALTEFPMIDGRFAADLQFTQASLPKSALIASGDAAAEGVKRALLFGLAAFAGEVEGIGNTLLKNTGDYLNTRQQFGTRLGAFQALQHMLANMVIAQEEIKSIAWLTASVCEGQNLTQQERLVRAAKARLGAVSRHLAETAVQLHGGIGVTDEFVVGHYLRRLVAIDAMYGDSQHQLLWLAKQY